jgi:hypothetical protein
MTRCKEVTADVDDVAPDDADVATGDADDAQDATDDVSDFVIDDGADDATKIMAFSAVNATAVAVGNLGIESAAADDVVPVEDHDDTAEVVSADVADGVVSTVNSDVADDDTCTDVSEEVAVASVAAVDGRNATPQNDADEGRDDAA